MGNPGVGVTTTRELPPNADETNTPPRLRNRRLFRSGDHCACVSTEVLSSDSGIVRPPPAGRMKTRMWVLLPAEETDRKC